MNLERNDLLSEPSQRGVTVTGTQNVLIFGASGSSGRRLVAEALELGHRVTAFVPEAKKLDMAHPNLNVMAGQFVDSSRVDEVVRGQDVVISALGVGMPLRRDAAAVGGGRLILAAARLHSVRWLVRRSEATGGAETRDLANATTRHTAACVMAAARRLLADLRPPVAATVFTGSEADRGTFVHNAARRPASVLR